MSFPESPNAPWISRAFVDPGAAAFRVNISKEVVLNGMLEFVEVWDREAWLAEYCREREQLDQYGDSLAKLGIL
jgi:DNA-binding transcriptional regulator/RsmH inhibitor MraZ